MADEDEVETEFLRGGVPNWERRSRTSEKRERVANEEALSELVKSLLGLRAVDLGKLELPEFVLDGLADAKKIKDPASLDRHLRHVRSLLRDLEWQPLLRRIDRMKAGLDGEETTPSDALARAEELLIQGDPGLARFLEEFPDADRSRLRQLVQNVKRAPEGRRAKARKQLEAAVAQVLAAGPASGEDSFEDE